MTKEEFYSIASPEKFLNISRSLNDDERDILKYKLSRLCAEELEEVYEVPKDSISIGRFNLALNCLSVIQPYKDRVPRYGLVYKERPDLMTDELLKSLQDEAEVLRDRAVINIEQYIASAETKEKNLVAEILEDSKELHALVNKHAGASVPSFISNYIYYDQLGHCSRPHVDNSFTSITVMIGLKHSFESRKKASLSFAYWPELPRYDYQLLPGEMAIFYGASTLHGRLPVTEGETVHSLLLSFRPLLS